MIQKFCFFDLECRAYGKMNNLYKRNLMSLTSQALYDLYLEVTHPFNAFEKSMLGKEIAK
jgi:hypothetical protein